MSALMSLYMMLALPRRMPYFMISYAFYAFTYRLIIIHTPHSILSS